jgi:hypothetical protein
MRVPGSFNGKQGRWCRVLRADRCRSLVDPDEVRRALRDPEPPRPAPAARSSADQGGPGDELLLLAPPVYFRALCGLEVPAAGGMVKCPLPDHDDAYASVQVFAEAERGWWCFGCARGGRVYDLGSAFGRAVGGSSGARRLSPRSSWRGWRSASTAAAPSSVGAGPTLTGAGLAVGLAVTLELLPARIDLVGFVLQFSGLGSLVALVLAVALNLDDALYAKYGTLAGAYAGLGMFLVLGVVQELG